MATTQRDILRQLVSEYLGDWRELTTHTNGDAGGTQVADTELANLTEADDGIQGWALMSSGNNDGEWRRIKGSGGYVSATTVVTVNFAFSNQVLASTTWELHRYDPQDIHQAINQALRSLAAEKLVWLPIRDESLAIDDQLSNSDFQTFSGGFTSWTEVGSPTVSQETTLVRNGTQSAKVISGGSSGQLTQAPAMNINEMTERTAVFKCWVYATATSIARIRLDWDGSSLENSDYHTGGNQWELLEAKADVPSTATQVKAICEVAGGTNIGYFGACFLAAEPVAKYTVPTTIVHGPTHVYIQGDEDRPNGPYYPLEGIQPRTGYRLRLEGYGALTEISSTSTAETGTTEVDSTRARLVASRAAEHFWMTLMNRARTEETKKEFGTNLGVATAETARLLAAGAAMPKPGAQIPNGWEIQEDSSGRYIVLQGYRPGITA